LSLNFFAGDARYDETNLWNEKVDGVTYNPALLLSTLRNIKSFASGEPTVFLPARDPEGVARIANKTTYL
jgi:glyoxylase-like metal-dependent hydrolase (beta-lactamase superfamily II)